jgi:hypothetical protein
MKDNEVAIIDSSGTTHIHELVSLRLPTTGIFGLLVIKKDSINCRQCYGYLKALRNQCDRSRCGIPSWLNISIEYTCRVNSCKNDFKIMISHVTNDTMRFYINF